MCAIARRRPAKRTAFTLIELLVVIAIIAVLAALGAGAYFATIGRQQHRNTETAVMALHKLIQQHWDQVVKDASSEDIPPAVKSWAGDTQRAKVIWIKLRLMEAFPATFNEIINHDAAVSSFWPYRAGLIPVGKRKYLADYKKKLAGASPIADEGESSACLLLALHVARGGIRFDRDTLGSAYFTDTNGDGIEEIVDGYRKPMKFFRFPTGNAELQSMAPQKTGKGATFTDPLDQYGLLTVMDAKWTAASRKQFEDNVHKIQASATQTCYVVPVLASSGKDVQFGLGADMSVAAAGLEADNVYSFRLRQ